MIEIKSFGGRVLYTAKDAKDVREALQEACGNHWKGDPDYAYAEEVSL